MEDMDPSTTAQPLFSIFQIDQHQPQLRQVMNDITTLAGVISELSPDPILQYSGTPYLSGGFAFILLLPLHRAASIPYSNPRKPMSRR